MDLLTRIRIFIDTLLGKEPDMSLAIGKKYPVLFDGEPAPANSLFEVTPSGALSLSPDQDGTVFATPHTAGDFHLGAQAGDRSGSVDGEIVAAPFEISFGDAVDL